LEIANMRVKVPYSLKYINKRKPVLQIKIAFKGNQKK
jgi:hypothetical protein